jgi:hypothetical protein
MKKNVRPILGYPGRSEVHLSIERGELDGECGSKEGMPENWIRDKKVNIVVRMLPTESDDIPNGCAMGRRFPERPPGSRGPTTSDGGDGPRKAVFVVSRQVPRERLTLLQNAFAAALQDKAFLEIARQRSLDVSPVTGKAAQELVTRVLDAPRAVL